MTIIKGTTYSLGTKVLETILSLSLLAILARLLEPKDFGIFAIVLAVQALLQPLLDMGLTPAYVKAENPTHELQNSFFTLNVALGIFNFIILVIIAPIVSNLYDNQLLFSLIIVFSFSVLFSSSSMQGYAQLTRDKRFDKLMYVSLVANIMSFIISVYAAYQNFGVWTLIIKAIVYSMVSMCMIFYLSKAYYKIETFKTIKKFTNELKFGFEIFINRVLIGVFNASDKFLFGNLFGIELLGHYSNSQQISRMADTHIRMPITSVIYSHLERYSSGDKKNFYNIFASIVFLITAMFSGVLILEGNILLIYFLGNKWSFASEYIQPLGLFGMAMVVHGLLVIIAMSENKLTLHSKRVFGSLVLLFIIYIMTYLISYNVLTFVYIFSISFFIYWTLFLIYELKLHKSEKSKITFLNSLVVVFFTIMLLSLAKNFIANEILELFIIVILFDIIIGLTIIYIYKKRKK